MSTPSARALIRLFTTAFVLLLGSSTNGRAHVVGHRHHNSRRVIAASVNAALPAAPAQNHVEPAPLPLLASEATAQDDRVQSAPAPAPKFSSLCSCERTTSEAARPPPFQA